MSELCEHGRFSDCPLCEAERRGRMQILGQLERQPSPVSVSGSAPPEHLAGDCQSLGCQLAKAREAAKHFDTRGFRKFHPEPKSERPCSALTATMGDADTICRRCGVSKWDHLRAYIDTCKNAPAATCHACRREIADVEDVICTGCYLKLAAKANKGSETWTWQDDTIAVLNQQIDELVADRADAEVLRHSNIIEIAVRNKSGSVSDYMKHWEGRALKAEAHLALLEADNKELKAANAQLNQLITIAAEKANASKERGDNDQELNDLRTALAQTRDALHAANADETIYVVLQCYGYEPGSVSVWAAYRTRAEAEHEQALAEAKDRATPKDVYDDFSIEEVKLLTRENLNENANLSGPISTPEPR